MPLLTSERRNCEPLKTFGNPWLGGGKEGGGGGKKKKKEKKNTKRGTFLRFQPDDLSMKSTLYSLQSPISQISSILLSTRIFPLLLFKTLAFIQLFSIPLLVVDASLIEIGQSSRWTVLRSQQQMYREGVARFSRSASTRQLSDPVVSTKIFFHPFHVSRSRK